MSEIAILSNPILKEIMEDAVVDRGVIYSGDLNEITTPGCYCLNPTAELANAPQENIRGLLFVAKGLSSIIHIIMAYNASLLTYRINWYKQGWSVWRMAQMS